MEHDGKTSQQSYPKPKGELELSSVSSSVYQVTYLARVDNALDNDYIRSFIGNDIIWIPEYLIITNL